MCGGQTSTYRAHCLCFPRACSRFRFCYARIADGFVSHIYPSSDRCSVSGGHGRLSNNPEIPRAFFPSSRRDEIGTGGTRTLRCSMSFTASCSQTTAARGSGNWRWRRLSRMRNILSSGRLIRPSCGNRRPVVIRVTPRSWMRRPSVKLATNTLRYGGAEERGRIGLVSIGTPGGLTRGTSRCRTRRSLERSGCRAGLRSTRSENSSARCTQIDNNARGTRCHGCGPTRKNAMLRRGASERDVSMSRLRQWSGIPKD